MNEFMDEEFGVDLSDIVSEDDGNQTEEETSEEVAEESETTQEPEGTEPEEHFMHEMYITRAYAAQAGTWRFIKEVSNWNLIDALRTHNAAINSLDDKADANN